MNLACCLGMRCPELTMPALVEGRLAAIDRIYRHKLFPQFLLHFQIMQKNRPCQAFLKYFLSPRSLQPKKSRSTTNEHESKGSWGESVPHLIGELEFGCRFVFVSRWRARAGTCRRLLNCGRSCGLKSALHLHLGFLPQAPFGRRPAKT